MVGEEPLDSKKKESRSCSIFFPTMNWLTEPKELKKKIDFIYETKMNPSALFAAQYAEAIKLREVDLILQSGEDLEFLLEKIQSGSTPQLLNSETCEECIWSGREDQFEKLTMNLNLFIVVSSLHYYFCLCLSVLAMPSFR